MLPEDFWTKVSLLKEHNGAVARGLSGALGKLLRNRERLLLVECLITWQATEGRLPRPTHRTARLHWLRNQLQVKLEGRIAWILHKKLALREGRRRIADLFRLYLTAQIQLRDAEAPEEHALLRDSHWWRIRSCIWCEAVNPLAAAGTREGSGSG